MGMDQLLGGLTLPEGTRWRDGRLWVSDIFNQRVLAVDLLGNVEVVAQLDDRPLGLGFLADGTLLVCLGQTRQIMRVNDQDVRVHVDLSGLADRINDMVSTPDGTLYIGTGTSGQKSCAIILVKPDATAVIAASDIPRANGIAMTPDKGRLIYAATDDKAIMEMEIHHDGLLSKPTVFAHTDSVIPDGICLDEQGSAWIGAMDGGFMRVAEGGEILERLPVEGGIGVTCVLGGPDRRTLFLAAKRGSHGELNAAVATGKVNADGFIAITTVAVPGAGWP